MNLLYRVSLVGLMLLLSVEANAATAVGKVLMAVGQVSAQGGPEIRPLERRSDIFVGDVLTTGKESQVQIRMNDGALIALGAEAVFNVKSYRFNEPGKKDEAVLSLVKGGLRTITGHMEKSGYRMETPAATLGIRGTIFDVYVAADGTVTVILREGGVDVTGSVGGKLKLDIAGLATIIKPGSAPTTPGPIPDDILEYLRSILPVPISGGTWEWDPEGGFIFTLDLDPRDILGDPSTGLPPPFTTGDGLPPIPPDPCLINPSQCG